MISAELGPRHAGIASRMTKELWHRCEAWSDTAEAETGPYHVNVAAVCMERSLRGCPALTAGDEGSFFLWMETGIIPDNLIQKFRAAEGRPRQRQQSMSQEPFMIPDEVRKRIQSFQFCHISKNTSPRCSTTRSIFPSAP